MLATPACITQALTENGLAGAGVHTWPVGQPPGEVDVGAHARAMRPQTGGGFVATPPLVAQLPPEAAGAATVTLIAPSGVGEQLEVTVCVPSPAPHELSRKNDITGPLQVTPVDAPHKHAEHVPGGAVRSALPSNTDVAAKPEPHGGAAP